MKTLYQIIFIAVITLGAVSCEIETVENPNAPTAESLLEGASLADLRLLAHGLESILRSDMEYHYWTTSIVGRDYYDLTGTDPRYTGELCGAQGAQLDNNGFLTTRAFNMVYRAVRNANNLVTATDNSAAGLSTEESNGIKGYAETLKAYMMLLELNRQYQNGIRIDVVDPDNRGPFLGYDESLAALAGILDAADNLLANAGDEFVFDLSSGFDGFNTPQTFRQFNRAVRARVATYQNDSAAALSALQNSFFDITGSMSTGVYHTFGLGGNDLRNPLFNVPNQDLYTVHPSWIADAEAGDTRVDQKSTPLDPDEVDVPVVLDGLMGSVQVTLYASDVANAPLIKNEELILIYAEANMTSNPTEAVAAIDAVRAAAGLGPYTGGTDAASLTNEILQQRRYGLFGEGHRWVDMRRFGRIDQIPTDRPGDVVHVQFPRPVLETN